MTHRSKIFYCSSRNTCFFKKIKDFLVCEKGRALCQPAMISWFRLHCRTYFQITYVTKWGLTRCVWAPTGISMWGTQEGRGASTEKSQSRTSTFINIDVPVTNLRIFEVTLVVNMTISARGLQILVQNFEAIILFNVSDAFTCSYYSIQRRLQNLKSALDDESDEVIIYSIRSTRTMNSSSSNESTWSVTSTTETHCIV